MQYIVVINSSFCNNIAQERKLKYNYILVEWILSTMCILLFLNRRTIFLTHKTRNFQYYSADNPIAFRGKVVVHMAVHTRTHGSVRTYTCKCTHVHCHVYDGMSVDSHWQVSTKQMGCAWLKDSNRPLLSLLVSFVDSVCSRFLITLI